MPYSWSYSVHFSFFNVFQCFSLHFTSYSVFFKFSMIFSFLDIIQVLQCAFLISTCLSVPHHNPGQTEFVSHFPTFWVSCHIPGTTVCVSHFPWFSVFSPYFRSYSVYFSFSCFSMFLITFHVLQCVFLIFHDFQFSRHTTGPTVCISYFPNSRVFFAVFLSHFPRFSGFSPYSMS